MQLIGRTGMAGPGSHQSIHAELKQSTSPKGKAPTVPQHVQHREVAQARAAVPRVAHAHDVCRRAPCR